MKRDIDALGALKEVEQTIGLRLDAAHRLNRRLGRARAAAAELDDHRRLGALVMDLLRELEPVHAFHAEVGHQDVEIVLAELFQRLFGVVSGDGAVSLHLQDLAA